MTRRRVIAAAGVLALSAGAFTFCGEDDLPAAPLSRPEEPLPPTVVAVESGGEVPDAGDLVAAWAAALRPLLRADAGTTVVWVSGPDAGQVPNPFTALVVRRPLHVRLPGGGLGRASLADALPDEGWSADGGQMPPEPDAGEPICQEGPLQVAIGRPPAELVVAIDTSGSMFDTLPVVNRWLLHRLEPALAGIDYRLQAIVDLHSLEFSQRLHDRRSGRKTSGTWQPSDAGVDLGGEVDSHDILRVLLDSAGRLDDASWVTRLRPHVPVHVILVTDDAAERGLADRFLPELTRAARGRLGTPDAPAFHLHALLGMAASAERWVARPEDPVVTSYCAVNAGVDYQSLVMETGGLRGSLCHIESFDAFTTALVRTLSPPLHCDTGLPVSFPGDRVVSVLATARDGRPPRPLFRAYDRGLGCSTANYFVERRRVTVCPATCQALAAEGFDTVEATARCP